MKFQGYLVKYLEIKNDLEAVFEVNVLYYIVNMLIKSTIEQ